MPRVLRQDVQLARLISRVERGVARVRQLTNGISDEALRWRPSRGGWAIAHFLEHATMVAQPYLRRLPRVIEKGRARGKFLENGKWKLSVPGDIARWTIGADAGVGSPPWFTRTPVPDAQVLERFFSTQAAIAKILRSAEGLSLGKLHCWMGGAVRWRLSDCCTLLVARTERDLAGVRKVRTHPDFPEHSRGRWDTADS